MRKTARIDRRKSKRQGTGDGALIGQRGLRLDMCENAVIEDYSGVGLKVRSGRPLKEEDSVVIYDAEGVAQYNAKVVWSKREGLIEKRNTGRPGQAFVAGCRLQLHKPKKDAKGRRRSMKKMNLTGSSGFSFTKLAFIGAGLILFGILFYAVSSLLTMF